MNAAPLKQSTWSLDLALERFFADSFEDGQLISHAWLEWALCLPKPVTASEVAQAQFVILDRVEQFKDALLKQHRIFIVSVRGKGYRVVPPGDQAFVAIEGAMRGVRKEFRRCQTVLAHTRMGELRADEARRHTDAQVKVSALAGMVGRAKREVFSLFRQ